MTKNQANAIYDILVEHCGAPPGEDSRIPFVTQVRGGCREYRCCHALGFGGKFWDANGTWYINGYKEDMTPEREEIIKRTDELLAKLKARPVIGITATGTFVSPHAGGVEVPFEMTFRTTVQSCVEHIMAELGAEYVLEEETVL